MKKLNDDLLVKINGGGLWAIFIAIYDAFSDGVSGFQQGWNSYTPGPRRAGHH